MANTTLLSLPTEIVYRISEHCDSKTETRAFYLADDDQLFGFPFNNSI